MIGFRWISAVLMAAGALLASPSMAVTISNFGFEDGPNGNQPGHVFGLRFGQLMTRNPGWDTYSTLSGWQKSGPGRIEMQSDRSAALNAHSGSHFISLDGGAGRNAVISQDLTLAKGVYILSFWYSPESLNAATNEIAYNLGNLVSGRATIGTFGAQYGIWKQVHTRIAVTTAGSYTLTFGGMGAADGVGGFIDDVEVATHVPVPAAGFGLVTGLGALTGLRRRRKAK